MKFVRNFRLIPLVLVAIACFGVLKIAALLLDGGYIFRDEPQQLSWAQEVLNFPTGHKRVQFDDAAADVTASVDKPEQQPAAKSPGEPTAEQQTAAAQTPAPTASERAVLERLQARRQELDARARELEIRESLLKAHEQRIEARIEELKGVEARIAAANHEKDEADVARFKGIVTMYENMKPRDAAKIFDRLEMAVLFDVASHMKPQKMSDVLAQMQPDSAERLTVELARRSGDNAAAPNPDLPKIEGQPIANSGK
jgi:flagellar motility protein MotE (MotC chaperone)